MGCASWERECMENGSWRPGERSLGRGVESGEGCEMKRGALFTHLLNPKVRGTRSGVGLKSEGSRVGVKRLLQLTRNPRQRHSNRLASGCARTKLERSRPSLR